MELVGLAVLSVLVQNYIGFDEFVGVDFPED